MIEDGLGQETDEDGIPLVRQGNLLHAMVISGICWDFVIWLVKCSILVFYWRLFNANRRSTRVIIWTLAAFVACWGTTVVRFCLRMLRVFADFLR